MAIVHKENIRNEARACRASIPGPSRLKAAEALATHLIPLLTQLDLPPAASVGCYLAIGTEINTSPVLRCLQTRGYSLCLPRTIVPSAPLEFVSWQLNEPLQQDLLGFPAPAGRNAVLPDAVIVPLVAFDRTGARIGQGAGLYDRTLALLRRERPGLPVIGLAFACQEVAEVPAEPHDQQLDYILTEQGLIVFEAAKKLDQRRLRL